jgi:phosphoenolpyruvate carboxylase
MPNAHLDADKDAPLRYDIRLLGRILGETIRAQEGERTFDTIERIRLTALRFHRDADPSAARELQNNIRTLSNGEAIQIIRAFGHFSHLANTGRLAVGGRRLGSCGGTLARNDAVDAIALGLF